MQNRRVVITGIGPEAALKLNIWAMPTPEAMQQLSSDPEYLKLKQYRNRIHNMDAITLYMASPTASCIQCVN